MTVSNLVGPLIIYLDRLLIGILISAEAITYYATPYEVMTKLLLIPAAIVGVLFPAFSATYLSDRNFSEKLFNRGVKYSFVIIFPIILFIIFFSSEGLNIWLGSNFVVASSFILKILCIGVLINSLAHLPFSLLQGIGRPDIVSKLQLIELPIFISLLFVVTKNYGINGVVMVWLFRIVVDAILLFFVSKGFLNFKFDYLIIVLICFSILTLSFPFFIDNLFARIISITIFYTIFVLLVWNYLLVDEEKNFFINKLKDNIKLMKFS
jgi:O-antigen/teichoic acid export membrane protein